jgi:hypothetical protein
MDLRRLLDKPARGTNQVTKSMPARTTAALDLRRTLRSKRSGDRPSRMSQDLRNSLKSTSVTELGNRSFTKTSDLEQDPFQGKKIEVTLAANNERVFRPISTIQTSNSQKPIQVSIVNDKVHYGRKVDSNEPKNDPGRRSRDSKMLENRSMQRPHETKSLPYHQAREGKSIVHGTRDRDRPTTPTVDEGGNRSRLYSRTEGSRSRVTSQTKRRPLSPRPIPQRHRVEEHAPLMQSVRCPPWPKL